MSVTSDGQRLYVTDLGHNRVLIWNSIPTQNGQAADVVVGQPNMTSELDNGGERHLRCDRHGRRRLPHLCRWMPDHLPFDRHRQRRHPALSRRVAASP